ncbi:hypothetical protein JCM6882_003188 [Rhodosporidiobolus microsporus]
MSTAPVNPPTPSTAPATSPAAPAASSSSSSSPAPPLSKSASPAPPAASKPVKSKSARRRKPVKRRGARADSESEAEDAQPGAGRGADDSDSDSDSDFAPSLHQSEDEDEDEDDSDDEADGATEPKTPANASIEQLEAPKGKGVKAVLAGQEVPASWSDMPGAGEEGASELPTLDFANLSLDAVESISPVKGKGATARGPKDAALKVGADGKPLSKKQLALQRREAKSAELKARDPTAWEAKEKAFAEKAEATRLAKKERVKERRKEKKAQEKAAREGTALPASAAPVASTSKGAVPPAASAAAAKPTRPVVPSRPSRTGIALGLVNPSSVPPASQPIASSASPSDPAAFRPVVPAFRQQPAFVRQQQGQVGAPGRSFAPAGESWRGRGGAAMRGATRGRGRGGARFGPDRWTAEGTVADESAALAAKEDERKRSESAQEKWGRGEAQRAPRPSTVERLPNWSHAGFEELEAEEKARLTSNSSTPAVPTAPAARGRGRGRGGAFAGRGSGVLAGPPGAINPRYAHLPFHPLHRYPALPASIPTGPASSPSAAAPLPSQPSPSAVAPAETAVPAPQQPAPESTTAANDQELFEEPAAKADKPAVGVRLPSAGATQFALAIKGAAAARAKEDAEQPKPVVSVPTDAKENEPIHSPLAAAASADLELRKQQGASILYAADPSRFAAPLAEEVPAPLAPYEQQPQDPASSLPPHLSGFMHQVPPHLQSPPTVQAPFIPRHDSPVYYPPQQFYSPDAFSMIPSPGITPPPVFPAHAPPSSAYFLPPRPNKRVEIKAPSRDGQSPVPVKPSPGPSQMAQQQQQPHEHQQAQPSWHQHQPASSFGSPGLARAPLPPTSPPIQPQLAYGAAPPSSYYGFNQSPFDTHPASAGVAYDGYYGMAPPPPMPATQHTYQQPIGGAYNPYAAGPSAVDSYGGAGAYYGGEQQQWGMY